MILLDPDLDPYPAPQAKPAKRATPAGISTRSLALFLRKAQAAVRLRGLVSVLLTTDKAIRKLNRQFRGKSKATDVLSFPAVDLFLVSRSRPGASENKIAGDLAISVDTARRQATACGHSLASELKVLMLHGLLHLAGYDHEIDDGEMAKRERALRAKLGLPLGLIERAASESASQRVGKSALSHTSRKNKASPNPGHPASTGHSASPQGRRTVPRRGTTNLAQGGVRRSRRNPGKAPDIRARRPVGPARKSTRAATRSSKP